MFFVVPFRDDDGDIMVPGDIRSSSLAVGLNDERCSESIGVLSKVVTVDPEGTVLTGSVDIIHERLADRDSTNLIK